MSRYFFYVSSHGLPCVESEADGSIESFDSKADAFRYIRNKGSIKWYKDADDKRGYLIPLEYRAEYAKQRDRKKVA